MKKTFRTLLAGALALCAVACYDDSALQEDLAGVKEDLSALQAEFETFKKNLNDEVAALKTSYQTLNGSFTEYKGLNDNQVAALNTALNTLRGQLGADENSGIRGQIADVLSQLNAYKTEANGRLTTAEAAIEALRTNSALKTELEALAAKVDLKADAATLAALAETVESITVRDIKEENGKIVVTLANGQTLSISKDGEGVVKVVDGNWVVVGADGTETDLDLPVSTPNLKFNVNWRNGELSYTTVENPTEDDWTFTGIFVSGMNNGSAYTVLTDVDISDSDEYIRVRIDSEWYNLPIVAEGGSDAGVGATLEILAGKTIVPVGGQKTVEINAVGVSDVYVMSKPDGWKAVVNGKALNITAPVEGNPYADQDGLILLHGTTETGQCLVAELTVTTSTAGIEIIVDDDAATVTIKNGLVVEGGNSDMGGIGGLSLADGLEDETEIVYSFASFNIGFGLVEDFVWAQGSWSNFIQQNFSFPIDQIASMLGIERGVYSPENPIEVLTFGIADFFDLLGGDWTVGTPTICFAFPLTENGMPDMGGLAYDYYNPMIVSIEEVSKSHTDVLLSVTRSGADSYMICMGSAKEVSGMTYLEKLESYFDSWVMSNGMAPLGDAIEVGNTNDEEVNLSQYGATGETSILMPASTYYAYAFPLTGKDIDDYSFEEDFLPYVKTFTTAPLTEGGSATLEMTRDEQKTSTLQIKATISVSGSADYVLYYFFENDPSEEDPQTLVDEMCANGSIAFASGAVSVTSDYIMGANKTRYLVAVAYDSEGHYGELAMAEMATK